MHKEVDVIRVFYKETFVGRLIQNDKALAIFEYDKEFLEEGFSISPFYLPLKNHSFVAKRDPFNGLFGVFNDSLPDGWGMLLMDRYLQILGRSINQLSFLDRLALIGSSGMGALSYQPDYYQSSSNTTTDINYLAAEVQKVISELDYNQSIKELYEQGGSSGGARPKAFIKHNEEAWIVKFPSSLDIIDVGRTEYLYSQIARKCGIEMSETALLEDKYFATKRFDRIGLDRTHMHSASGLLYASHRFPSMDYTDLIKATFLLTKDIEEAYKVFRLMVFNVLTGNKDDHAKNFSFLYKDASWLFAPAYDLVFNDGFNGNHSTSINGNGNPNKNDLFVVAEKSGLNLAKTKHIFDEVWENTTEIKKVSW